jgi:hypothetical protein
MREAVSAGLVSRALALLQQKSTTKTVSTTSDPVAETSGKQMTLLGPLPSLALGEELDDESSTASG